VCVQATYAAKKLYMAGFCLSSWSKL